MDRFSYLTTFALSQHSIISPTILSMMSINIVKKIFVYVSQHSSDVIYLHPYMDHLHSLIND